MGSVKSSSASWFISLPCHLCVGLMVLECRGAVCLAATAGRSQKTAAPPSSRHALCLLQQKKHANTQPSCLLPPPGVFPSNEGATSPALPPPARHSARLSLHPGACGGRSLAAPFLLSSLFKKIKQMLKMKKILKKSSQLQRRCCRQAEPE